MDSDTTYILFAPWRDRMARGKRASRARDPEKIPFSYQPETCQGVSCDLSVVAEQWIGGVSRGVLLRGDAFRASGSSGAEK
jgi:hypothetical protein